MDVDVCAGVHVRIHVKLPIFFIHAKLSTGCTSEQMPIISKTIISKIDSVAADVKQIFFGGGGGGSRGKRASTNLSISDSCKTG